MTVRGFVLYWGLCWCGGVLVCPSVLCGQQPSLSVRAGKGEMAHVLPQRPMVREIYVPEEQFSVLLGAAPEHVFLPRHEYEQLLRQAAQKPAQEAPARVLLTDAEYRIRMEDGRATIEGQLAVEVLEPHWHALPLVFRGVGLHEAFWDGQPAPLVRDTQAQVQLLVSQIGQHSLRVGMTAPVAVQAAQQTLQIQVPAAPSTRVQLVARGNVEVKSGAKVLRRTYDTQRDETDFELVAEPGVWNFVLSLNNRLLQKERLIVARSVIADHLMRGREFVQISTSMHVLHGAVEELRLYIPADLEVQSVESEWLARWQLTTREDGRRELLIGLRTAVTDTVSLIVHAERNLAVDTRWQFPHIEWADVSGSTAVLAVIAEFPLELAQLDAQHVIGLDAELAKRFVATGSELPPGTDLRPLMAFYAPGSHYQVTADIRLPAPYWNVLTSVLLQLSRQETKATGVFTLRAQNERLFEFSFVAPQRWTVTEARDEKQERLPFEVFPQEDGRSRVVVRFNRAVVPGETYTVMFDSAAQLPGWLEEWESQQIQFPVFVAEQTASNQGALAVVASEELEVWPEVLENLSPLDRTERQRFGVVPEAPIALLFDAPGYAATIRVERRRPKVTAQTYSFFHLAQGRLTAHYEIRYLVRQATTRQLTAVLPRQTPTELVVRGARGTTVAEFRPTETDSERLWHVVLADNVPLDSSTGTGEAHLVFEFQMPISENSEPMQLPLIRAADVGSQSGYFAIEATPERQVTIDTAARRVDPGELSEAEYQPGPTLIGAFSFANVVPVVTVQAEPRTLHDLPAAVVERAALASILSAHGVVQTQARMSLKTKLTWLELKLPDASAQLLAVVVDGIPVMPQRHEQSLLIPLPLGTESLSRTLVVTYEHQVPRLSWRTLCDLQPPVLLLPSSQAEQQGGVIPVADLNWKVLLPAGYAATWVDEGFGWRYSPRPSIARRLWQTVSGALVLGAGYAAPHVAMRDLPTSQMAVEAMPQAPARMELTDEAANTEMRQLLDKFSAGIAEQDAERGSIVAAAPATVPGRPSPANGIDVSKASEDQKQQAAGEAPVRTTQLLGVRSLDIDLLQALREAPAERLIEVANMGGQKELRLTLWNDTRSGYLAYVVGLAVIVLGWRARRSLRSGARYLVVVLSLSLVVPAALGWMHELERIRESCHLGCAFLAVLYLGTACRRWTTWFTTRLAAAKRRRPASQAVGNMALFLGFVLGWHAEPLLGQSPMRPNDLVEELQRLLLAPPLQIPEDAIVIPYDASAPSALPLEGAQRVLVPYKKYVELWNRAHPDTPLDKLRPIYAYALGPAQFETTLSDERHLRVRGSGQILVLQAQPVGIVLPFAGGVLVQATLDGQPATIQVDAPQHLVQNAPQVAPGQLALHVDRPGWHSWQMEFSFPVEKNGGWRVVRGVLPTQAAASLRVTVPDPATEVRILGAADRETWLSDSADYRLRTSVADGGMLHLQWRPQAGGATIDNTITVQSDSVLDVLEDGMKLAWKGVIQLRGATRDTFSLLLPGDYLVERVAGPNVRGWRQEADGDRMRLHVALLRAASEQEELQLYLGRRWSLLESRQATFTAPIIQVEDASREQGTVAIRSSPSVELQALSDRGITRVDIDNQAAEELVRTIGQEERLLPMRPFQTVRFPRLPFHWEAVARLQQALFSTQLQALLRTSERQLRWECRVVVQHRGLPLNMLNVELPKTLHVENVSVPEWVVSSHGERQQLSLYFSTGKMGRFVVDLAGTAGQRTEEQPVEIPVITVPGAERQESQWVVQVDPAYRLQVEDLVQGQVVPLEQTFSWLRPEQRQAAARGLAIAFRSADYRGILSLSRRKPVVRYTTLTNVNFTPHAVEETVLIELRITEAGIPGVSFTLPARLADARFHIPSLRRKTIAPVAPDMPDQEPRAHVHVEFQDELMVEFTQSCS